MTTNENMPVYIIGKNQDNKFHIYSCSREVATSKGHLYFPTWMKARRHLKRTLEENRSQVMLNLFKIDKDLRWVGKLKEVYCNHLEGPREPLEEFTEATQAVDNETSDNLQAR